MAGTTAVTNAPPPPAVDPVEARNAGREGLATALVFLFAVRWGAWSIALILVAFGNLSADNSPHEPLLLMLALAQTFAATAYVPVVRPWLQQRAGHAWRHARDLIALGLADVALSLAVVYFSGGWGSPYYHFAVASLLAPTFLLSRRRSALVLVAFLAAYMAVLATAGQALDASWRHEGTANLAGVLITPVLVVIVVQYLSALTYRLELQADAARRAYQETSALYGIAQVVAASDDPARLVAHTCRTLQASGRFRRAAVFSLRGSELRLETQAGGPRLPPALPLSVEQVASLSPPDGVAALVAAGETLSAVPVRVQEATWGVVAFAGIGEESAGGDLRFVRAVAGQLSLGLTKISLSRQKEELAAQEERSRIAREIHDGIAQSVYMMSLNLEKAADEAKDEARLGGRLAGLVGLAKETLLEVRHYIFDLKPLLSGDQTLAATIRGQVQEFTSVSGLPVNVSVEGREEPVPVSVASALYRITQEALSNVYRHAAASAIDLRLAFTEGALVLEVRDDGRGFAVEPGGGRGLRNMRQRAAELGGCAEITSEPGAGTTVRVTLPLAGQGAP